MSVAEPGALLQAACLGTQSICMRKKTEASEMLVAWVYIVYAVRL